MPIKIAPPVGAVSDIAEFITSFNFIWGYIGLIAIIFLIVLLQFYWKLKPLRKALNGVIKIVQSTGTMESFAGEFPDLDDRISMEPVLLHPWNEFKETLLFPGVELESDLEQIHNTHPAGFFFSRESIIAPRLNLRFYNAFPGILTALGIMGTFVGLVAGIYLASGGLAADDINEAKLALGNLLSGASLAFGTSIAGLITSMLSSWGEKRALHNLDTLVDNFVVSLDKRVKRLPAEKIHAAILSENRQQTKALQSFTNDLAIKFAEVLEDKISKPMGESMDLLLESLELLRTDQTKASDEILTKLMSEFSESITGAAGSEMSQLAETLNKLNEVFTEQATSASHAQKLTYELLQDATESIRSCVTEVANATEKNQLLITEVNSLLGLARESQARITETVIPLKGLVDTVTASTQAGVETAGIMKDCAVDISAAVENLAEIGEQTSQSWSDYQTRFENVDQQLANTFVKLQEGLDGYSANLSRYLHELESETAKVVTHLAGGTKGLEEAVEELADVMSRNEKH